MTDIEVQVEVQLISNSPSKQSVFVGLQEDMSCEEGTDCKESRQNSRQGGKTPSSGIFKKKNINVSFAFVTQFYCIA